MNVISKFIIRTKEYGIRYVTQVILQHKVYRPLNCIMQRLCNKIYERHTLKNIIVIESHNDFDSNGGAFYNYLIKHKYNEKYRIVWLIKHLEYVPKKLPKNVECVPFYELSFRKNYFISNAKYLFADNEITGKAKNNQISIYMGHGAFALKNVKSVLPDSSDIDYVISSSENYNSILAEQVGVNKEKMLVTGYPFHDSLFDGEKGDLHKVVDKLKYNKVIMWMPTFRKGGGSWRNDICSEQEYGIPIIDNEKQFESLSTFLQEKNNLLIIKIHPKQDIMTIKKLRNRDNIIILTADNMKEYGLDNYRLLKDVDALISDYSSIMYSYLLLNRPMGFVLSDLKEYKLGLVVDNVDDFITGEKIFDFNDLLEFIADVNNGKDEYEKKRKDIMKWLYDNIDGNSCERICASLNL